MFELAEMLFDVLAQSRGDINMSPCVLEFHESDSSPPFVSQKQECE
jgi:hypothetical protein